MKAVETSMLQFLRQQNQEFAIPVYQRTYKWTRIHCSQLWKDILRASGTNSKTHFIGSIVYITDEHYQATKVKQLTIIDGQQRITTISLLLMAMCNYIDENPDKYRTTSSELYNQYLVNQFQNKFENEYIKLVLTKHDEDFYEKLIRKKDLPNDNHNISNNYRFFYEEIKNQKIDIDVLYDGIAKLMMVDVSLIRSQDDPQLIFESLNSTGAKLTQADLIRNYLLMNLSLQFQNRLYTDYWYPIESRLKEEDEELSNFIRDYLIVKNKKPINKTKVYDEFKRFFNNNYSRDEESLEPLVKELFDYCRNYEKIIRKSEGNDQINQYLKDFSQLDVTVVYPLLIKFYSDYDSGILSLNDFIYILKLIESFIVRRIICEARTNSLGKVFISLIKDIKESDYVKSVERILISKKGYQWFPNDEEFKEKFITKDIYNLKSRRFILDKIENNDNKQILNIDMFTIEHIMPQTNNLSYKWVSALGKSWHEIHNKYMHTIGNLTLTRYNSEMGKKFFVEKRDMKGGFRDSACRLNEDLKDLNTWNEHEIIKRANRLFDIAKIIWVYPHEQKDEKIYNKILDFDDDWTGKKVSNFTFMDKQYAVRDITNLYTKIVELIYEIDPDMFIEIINNDEFINKRFASKSPGDFNKSHAILNSEYYLNTTLNSETKKRNLALLIEKIGLDENDFIICL